jgi:RimJ/RimL family protein N-acetyltransferase
MTDRDGLVQIAGERVMLRDPVPEDFEARCRWYTIETAWQDWDAPWEGKSVSPPGPPEEHEAARRRFLEKLVQPPPTPRTQLWVQVIGGPLLGWVNRYHHDPVARTVFIGIDICESAYWHQGLGTEAFKLWRDYLVVRLDLTTIHTATWSGNVRMVRVAEKCGFALTDRNVGNCEVRGEKYDGLTFALTRERWMELEGAR